MELWDIYDIDRNKTGRTIQRGETLAGGDYHLVVHVCIFNAKGQMLIQQRQSFKEGWPNLWDITVGGSAVSGESSQTAAEREVLEELGIRLDLQGVRPHFTIQFGDGFDDIYLIEQEVDLSGLKLQYEEVQDAKWADREEVLELLKKGAFIPYYENYIKLLFDMKTSYGCHKKENRL